MLYDSKIEGQLNKSNVAWIQNKFNTKVQVFTLIQVRMQYLLLHRKLLTANIRLKMKFTGRKNKASMSLYQQIVWL